MKRTVAFLAAVCLSTGVLFATVASAQYSPPPSSPPPTQTPPTPASDASGDTLKTKDEAPAQAAPDSMTSAAKARRVHMTTAPPRSYVLSLALGSASNSKPDAFNENFSPSLGAMLSFGVRQYGVTAGVNFNYNFFLVNGTVPNDLSIFTIFGELKYTPTKNKARPYLILCGGYFRQWIVDLDYTENVLGYGGGAGVEMELNRSRRLFIEGRYIEGQTRKIEPTVNTDKSNTTIIPVRLGVTWEFR